MTLNNLKASITVTVQKYFDRHGIKETALIVIKESGPFSFVIESHTLDLLNTESLIDINHIVHLLMPIGAMYEFVNVVIPETTLKSIKGTVAFDPEHVTNCDKKDK